jgi:hypothetical protein
LFVDSVSSAGCIVSTHLIAYGVHDTFNNLSSQSTFISRRTFYEFVSIFLPGKKSVVREGILPHHLETIVPVHFRNQPLARMVSINCVLKRSTGARFRSLARSASAGSAGRDILLSRLSTT